MHSNKTSEQSGSLWKPAVDEKEIHRMEIPQLEKECAQPLPIIDADAADVAVIKCRVLASKLRNKHQYFSAKNYYHQAVSDIEIMLGELSETEHSQRLACYRIWLLETKIDFCLTLFEQGCNSQCLDKLSEIESKIDKLNEGFKGNAKERTLLLNYLLLRAETHVKSEDIEKAKEYLGKAKLLFDSNTSPEFKARLSTAIANLFRQEGNFKDASTNYGKAFRYLYEVVKSNPTRGGCLRYASSTFNLARSYGENGLYKKGIGYLTPVINLLTEFEEIGAEDPLTCRLRLEMARLYECDDQLQDAIHQAEAVNCVHKKNLGGEAKIQFHPFDLREHLGLVKRLAYWYAKVNGPLEAGNCFIDAADALKAGYPYQRMHCLKQALCYFQAVDGPERNELLAATLTSLAETYKELPCPDLISALATIKNAISLQESPERTALQENIQIEYEAQFRGWHPEWIIQWSWCLHNLSDFQQNWASFGSHRDDFFHWQAESQVLPPQRRVQLAMLLSRLYCLLDQSYNYFIKQTVYAGEKNPPHNLYFPFGLSRHCLDKKWREEQMVWDRSVVIAGVGRQLGFNTASFRQVRDTIIGIQPFESETSVLFKLQVVTNYSKHVHIGVQIVPPNDVQMRSGLIKRRFSGVKIGFTRMGGQVCPFSFTDLLGNPEASKDAYRLLLDAGMLIREDPLDDDVAIVSPHSDIDKYLRAITDVNSAEAALEACKDYSRLIAHEVRNTAIGQRGAEMIGRFLLNLVAQARGLEETQDSIDGIPFIDDSCRDTSRLLHLLSANQETITGEHPAAVIAVEELTQVDAIQNKSFDSLDEQYQETLLLLRRLDPKKVKLPLVRRYHEAAAGLFSYFLALHSAEDIDRLLADVRFVLPACLVKSYLDRLNEWQSSRVVPPEIPLFSAGTDTDCIDDDLLARIKYVHKIVYYNLPFYLFLQNPSAKMLRINMSVDVYLQIHFILDQIYKRYVSKSLGEVSNELYPVSLNALDKEKNEVSEKLFRAGHVLPADLSADIGKSFGWWRNFRLLTLRAKHCRLGEIAQLAGPGFSNACNLPDLDPSRADYVSGRNPPEYNLKLSGRNGVKLLQMLKTALCDTQAIVLKFSQAIAALPPTVKVYNHLRTMQQVRQGAPKNFSAAGVPQSALRSLGRSSFMASLDMPSGSQSQVYEPDEASSGGGGGGGAAKPES